ncbi:hypothetical protein T440DRAFT_526738 [Plenodomus tracheiphilus IPT5]|uniref:BTB domain-containing protein n=1 Tax=Plenodomus tracheiphilus IPT5 TaxID=1408161 RepID=A0A6A7BCZ1_9PLEO|nr:hypothetical protein T440DRAFT_526738 [Plenodomus tracheiphilus IPT5]
MAPRAIRASFNNMPPPPPPPRNQAPRANNWAPNSDNFLNMLQGPAIKVIVGSGPAEAFYMLPIALLANHSLECRRQINHMVRSANVTPSLHNNKKRKWETNPSDDEETGTYGSNDRVQDPSVEGEKTEILLRFSDIDPTIFGLFVKFMYQGSYPVSVDARQNTNSTPHTRGNVVVAPPNPSSPKTATPQHTQTDTASSPSTPTATYVQFHDDITRSLSITPPSIHAWLLASRLLAIPFLNHTMQNIFSGIGPRFALTPLLFFSVWAQTDHMPDSALRKILMDVLITHWHGGPSHNHVVARAGREDMWESVFNVFGDIRKGLLFGKVEAPLVVGRYFCQYSREQIEEMIGRGATRNGNNAAPKGNGELTAVMVSTETATTTTGSTASTSTSPTPPPTTQIPPNGNSAPATNPIIKEEHVSPTQMDTTGTKDGHHTDKVITIKEEAGEDMDMDTTKNATQKDKEKDTVENMEVDDVEK